jgi:branched-chain amino acid transport system permease protein
MRPILTKLVAAAIGTTLLGVIVPAVAAGYWTSVAISAAIYVLPIAGCGLLYGRLGMLTMFQVAILGVGAWVALRISFATSLPFPLIMLISGLIACAIGVTISVPALRLSRIHFALLTLMAAGAAEVVFSVIGFPNGGSGFTGERSGLLSSKLMSRPSIATSDPAFLRYTLVVVFVLSALLWWQMRGRTGRAWALIRQGTPCAQAAGINVRGYLLWAVACGCFITGVAGALLAAQLQTELASSFVPENSVIVFAVALLGGTYSIGGYLIGGISIQVIPAIISKLGASSTVGLIVFGVGLVVTLLVAPEGTAGQLADLRQSVSVRRHRLHPSPARNARADA